jgi:hypothetical protein
MVPREKKSDNKVGVLVSLGSLGMAVIVTILLPFDNLFLKIAAGFFMWLVIMSIFRYNDSKQ